MSAPFAQQDYRVAGAKLRLLEPDVVPQVAACLVAMEPWRNLGYQAAGLEQYLTRPDPALHRFGVWRDGHLAGIVCPRHPWLRGAYLELLGLWPSAQGQGLGGAILDWLTDQISPLDTNLWTAVSRANGGARRFYARHGFLAVGDMADLVRRGHTEILLRKRLDDPGRT